jgi:hypothetical protein
MENSNKKLSLILRDWKFPLDIIEKYKILGIHEIFEWQRDCISNTHISGS